MQSIFLCVPMYVWRILIGPCLETIEDVVEQIKRKKFKFKTFEKKVREFECLIII